jgi:hypothetical protein
MVESNILSSTSPRRKFELYLVQDGGGSAGDELAWEMCSGNDGECLYELNVGRSNVNNLLS